MEDYAYSLRKMGQLYVYIRGSSFESKEHSALDKTLSINYSICTIEKYWLKYDI